MINTIIWVGKVGMMDTIFWVGKAGFRILGNQKFWNLKKYIADKQFPMLFPAD
jgi:hypothetical protein